MVFAFCITSSADDSLCGASSSEQKNSMTTPQVRKKKVDSRVRTLIENGVKLRHRTMFVIVGAC